MLAKDTPSLGIVQQAAPETILPQPTEATHLSPYANVSSNPKWQYRNSLNSTHYMLYHAETPPQATTEPFTFGFLTTMARLEVRMRHKKPLTVTIIGGSVTAAYCKEPRIGCWVTPVSEWFLQENPQVQIHRLFRHVLDC